MRSKHLVWVVGLLCVFAGSGAPALAQNDQEEPQEQTGASEPADQGEQATPAEQAEPAEEQAPVERKPGFWGDRFALYIEAAYGTGSADDLDTSISSASTRPTFSSLSLSDQSFGRVAVGWKLPADHGGFRLVFNGYKEDSYEAQSVGYEPAVIGSPLAASSALPWWHLVISNGRLEAQRIPPQWSMDQDVSQGGSPPNGIPDANEVTYGAADRTASGSAPDSLQNRLQTVDVLYHRDFGGRRVSGAWSSGLRYYVYKGNLVTGAWLRPPGTAGLGFTDGASLDPLIFSQDSSGVGPTGSLAVSFHLFRRRLSLFAEGRIAFLLETLELDSGDFFTLTPNGSEVVPSPARLTTKLDKSTWHVGAELGARVKIVEGLTFELAFNRTSYQDAVILPFSLQIPATVPTIGQSTLAQYATQDLIMETWHAGFGFQF